MRIKARMVVHLDDIKTVKSDTLKKILRDIEVMRVKAALRENEEENKPLIIANVKKDSYLQLHTAGSFEDRMVVTLESLMTQIAEEAESLDPEEINELYKAVFKILAKNRLQVLDRRLRTLAWQEEDTLGDTGMPVGKIYKDDYLFGSLTALESFKRTKGGKEAVRTFEAIESAQENAMKAIGDAFGEPAPEPSKEKEKKQLRSAEKLIDSLFYENGSPRVINADGELAGQELLKRLKPGVVMTVTVPMWFPFGVLDVTLRGKYMEYNPRMKKHMLYVTEQLDYLDEVLFPPNQAASFSLDDIISIEG